MSAEQSEWQTLGIVSYVHDGLDPLEVESVLAAQRRGDRVRYVKLDPERRVGPATGGSNDHDEDDSELDFHRVGVVNGFQEDETFGTFAGVVYASGDHPDGLWRWYWERSDAEVANPEVHDAYHSGDEP